MKHIQGWLQEHGWSPIEGSPGWESQEDSRYVSFLPGELRVTDEMGVVRATFTWKGEIGKERAGLVMQALLNDLNQMDI